MGITVSHSTLPPISLASTIIGFISFAFTLATFLKVFWASILTLRAAPTEITDYLSNLKQALLEERRHLRKVRKRMRSALRRDTHADADHEKDGRSRSRSRSRRRNGAGAGARPQFDRASQAFRSAGEAENLRLLRTSIRDMIRSFRALEHPFLRPQYQDQDAAHWSTNTPSSTSKPRYLASPSHSPYYYDSDDEGDAATGLARTDRLGAEYRTCGLRERWLWLHRRGDVVAMQEGLARVQVRRVAHEVGSIVAMVGDLGRDVEGLVGSVGGLEGRLRRVVGVRRVD